VELAFALAERLGRSPRGRPPQPLGRVRLRPVVWLGFRISKRPATLSHPYGYDRAEDLAGLGVALVIWALRSLRRGGQLSQACRTREETTHLGLAMVWPPSSALIGQPGRRSIQVEGRSPDRPVRHPSRWTPSTRGSTQSLLSAPSQVSSPSQRARGGVDPVAGVRHLRCSSRTSAGRSPGESPQPSDAIRSTPPSCSQPRKQATSVGGCCTTLHVRARWMGRTLLVEVDRFRRCR